MRETTYSEAIREAIEQEMQRDSSVVCYGLGVPDGIYGTTLGLRERFGERCFDTPISEEGMTGFGVGAAMNGLRPIHIHIRADFLLLALNQVVNMMSCVRFLSAGQLKVPMVIRAVIGRGWGQGCQHSKSLHAMLARVPGLKVILPTTPYDAKGMLTAAIRDDNPVLMFEHRWLYWSEGEVPIAPYTVEIGLNQVLKPGDDITMVSVSWMNVEALKAREILERYGVSVELIDLRTVAPLDAGEIVKSVNKTGYCIVSDVDWVECGIASEVAAIVHEHCFDSLKKPVKRIGFAPTHCPTARCLEDEFYPNAIDLIRAVEVLLDLPEIDLSNEDFYSHGNKFTGPF